MSEKKLNLKQKLHAIQVAVMGLGKDKASQGYRYVTGDKVLSHIKPLMNEHGLILVQEVTGISNNRQDYTVGAGTDRERIKSEILTTLDLVFTWMDVDSDEEMRCEFKANGQNDWEKGVGSALTYGERYFLLKFFHINTDEDDIDNPERKEVHKVERKEAAKTPPKELPILTKDHPSYNAVKGYISSTKDTALAMQNSRTKFNISTEVEKELLKTK